MNIDIINRQVADKLAIKESKVRLINTFFWQNVKQHLYDYNSKPVNIENVCVLYPDKYKVKKEIYKYIGKLKALKYTKKFKPGSIKHQSIIDQYNKMLRGFLKIRKENKFTN